MPYPELEPYSQQQLRHAELVETLQALHDAHQILSDVVAADIDTTCALDAAAGALDDVAANIERVLATEFPGEQTLVLVEVDEAGRGDVRKKDLLRNFYREALAAGDFEQAESLRGFDDPDVDFVVLGGGAAPEIRFHRA